MKTFKSLRWPYFVLFFLLTCANHSSWQEIRIGKATLRCELAATVQMRNQGLMFRQELAQNSGMLFIFPDEVPRAFWMKNTSIPLSIAYISRQGVIKEINDMKPFSLEIVFSQNSATYALEVNQGVFSRLGIKVGDAIHAEDLKKLPVVKK